MGELRKMIETFCPYGVHYRKLKEVFNLYNGMTGVSDKWAENGNCKFIDYLNVFNNLKVKTDLLKNATVKKLNQNVIEQFDILCTSASETPCECAKSAVVEDYIDKNVFLDDHLFGLRLKDEYKDKIDII